MKDSSCLIPSREVVWSLRAQFPSGSRVRLLHMDDVYGQAPPRGTLGTVDCVDDIGTIHVRWDNGSGLGVAYGEDCCERIDLEEDV